MAHVDERLQERLESNGITKFKAYHLRQLAMRFNVDTAVLLTRLDKHIGENESDFTTRNESNGDFVFLIIRNRKPQTVMFRRSNQSNDVEHLRVNQIVELKH